MTSRFYLKTISGILIYIQKYFIDLKGKLNSILVFFCEKSMDLFPEKWLKSAFIHNMYVHKHNLCVFLVLVIC